MTKKLKTSVKGGSTSGGKKPAISHDMPIDQVVSKYPETYELLLGYGLHCMGCYGSAFETIEEGLMTHGYDDEEIAEIIQELNDFIKSQGKKRTVPKEADDIKVKVSKKALAKITKTVRDDGKEGWLLRVEAQKIAGKLKFSMNFIEKDKTSKYDKIFPQEKDSVKIVLDKRDYDILKGLEIDYIKEKNREGFKLYSDYSRAASSDSTSKKAK